MTRPGPHNGESKLAGRSAPSIWFLPYFNNLRAMVVLAAVRLGHELVVLIPTVFSARQRNSGRCLDRVVEVGEEVCAALISEKEKHRSRQCKSLGEDDRTPLPVRRQ